MKLNRFLSFLCVAACHTHLLADDLVVYVSTSLYFQTSMSPGFELYNKDGVPLGISGSWYWIEDVDADSDGTMDYARIQLYFSGVTPGQYSIAFVGGDWNGNSIVGWSGIYDTSTLTELGHEAFSSPTAPVNSGGSDETITGYLDVHGNLMNFGTLSGMPSGPAIQYRFADFSANFDTSLGRYYSPNGAFSTMTWSFPAPSSDYESPRMSLYSNGRFQINGSTGGSLIFEPNPASLTINGSPVLTQTQLQNGSLVGLRVGGATGVITGSVATGSGSSAMGYSSFASGISASTNSYAMTALGRYNRLSSGQSTSSWVSSDDLFVIGNGSSVSNPSNAVTIKKSGAIGFGNGALSGAPNSGLGGVDIAYGGAPATLMLGAEANLSSRTNFTTKFATIATPHHAAASSAVASLFVQNSDSSNQIIIGGGTNSLYAATDIEFRTAPSTTTPTGARRFAVDRNGNVVVGGSVTPTGSSQVVLGAFNAAKDGSLVVGFGTGNLADPPETRNRNAVRVATDGAVLIPASGDIGMGEFTSGEQP